LDFTKKTPQDGAFFIQANHKEGLPGYWWRQSLPFHLEMS